ncbi:hypothetical protein [Psychromonas sp. KJ10-2]|uniref:hypothetical protein n=1 Tax=Psychromonas sp. KJ10-2 TaxID=3391822 RepID=UPI0039B659D8
MLFISTKDHFDSTCMTPEKFDVIANDFHKPLYSLTKLMEDDIVANHYDWAYFREFASSNKTTAFYSVVIRKEDDAQNHYKDIIHKTFNYETLSSINPMVIKHAMLHINAGENFKYSDYENIGNELVSLSKKDVPVIMGSSIDTELPKNVIQVSILLLGIEVIEGQTITYEYESNRLEELLPVPEFLIKNTNK